MRKLFLSLLLCCAGLWLPAQQSNHVARIDSLLNVLNEAGKVMGSVSIFRDGEEMYQRSIGFCNVEKALKADNSSVYRIGSISKMFTAVMILQLIEEQKLSTETLLENYFPAIPNASEITIDQMLGHRSGIHSITDDSLYLTYNTKFQSKEQILDLISSAKPNFQPGEQTAYSNSNYILLGYILEQLTAKSYAENLTLRITKPLGLSKTAVGKPAAQLSGGCYSYHAGPEGWEISSETDMSIPGGAGAIVSTPSELNLFIQALFNGKLLRPASLELMTSLRDHFGYGIFAMPFYDHKGFGHTGGIDDFVANLAWFPDSSYAVAVNLNGASFSLNELMIGLLSALYDKPYTLPKFKTAVVDATLLESYTGTYSSPALPIKLTVSRKDQQLFAQGTGQQSFPLEATDEKTFRFDLAGIVIVFAENSLTLQQGGSQFVMTKE